MRDAELRFADSTQYVGERRSRAGRLIILLGLVVASMLTVAGGRR